MKHFYFGYWISRAEAYLWVDGKLTDAQLLMRRDEMKPHEIYWIGNVLNYIGLIQLINFLREFPTNCAFRTSNINIVKFSKRHGIRLDAYIHKDGPRYIGCSKEYVETLATKYTKT